MACVPVQVDVSEPEAAGPSGNGASAESIELVVAEGLEVRLPMAGGLWCAMLDTYDRQQCNVCLLMSCFQPAEI